MGWGASVTLRPLAIWVLALITTTGIVGEWSGVLVPWWRLFAAMLVIGLVWDRWMARRQVISVHRIEFAALHLGRRETLQIELTNHSARPARLQFEPALPMAIQTLLPVDAVQEVVIAPAGKLTHSIPIQSITIGEVQWSKLPVRLAGPSGLAWWSRQLAIDATISVVPDTWQPNAGLTGVHAAPGAQTFRMGTGLELHHLRDYQAGDPRQLIDWKASARSGHLISRVHARDTQLRVVVVLDTGRTSRTALDGLDQLGHYINLTSRLLEYAARNGDCVGLVTFSDRIGHAISPAAGLSTVAQIRQALSSLEARPVEGDVLMAALRVRQLVSQRTLVILLSDLFQGTTTSQLAAAVRAWVPKHQPILVGLIGKELGALGHQTASHWLDPYQSLAALEYKRQLDSSVESLRRLGAMAVSTTPDELEARVFRQYQLLRLRGRG